MALNAQSDNFRNAARTTLLWQFIVHRETLLVERLETPEHALTTRTAETVSYTVANLADLKVCRMVRRLIEQEQHPYQFTGIQHYLHGYLLASAQRMAGMTPDPMHVQTVAMVANLLDLMEVPETRLTY